jgi:serine O-acetyltransferase
MRGGAREVKITKVLWTNTMTGVILRKGREGTALNSALWRTLRADLYRYGAGADKSALVRTLLREPGFRFTWYLRKVAFYSTRKRSVYLFAYLYNRFMLNHYKFRYGFDISPRTAIGPGFYLGHFGGIVISPFAVLGANVNVAKGATIGATSRGSRKGAPTLEDRVWVGANATIVGRITVGHDALIAPGAYVNFDVPSRAVVLGNPGKVVAQTGSEGYINHLLENEAVSSEAKM